MIEWSPVAGSSRVTAEAYDPEAETIYVRFPDGVEWFYAACPPDVWERFTAPSQSRGEFIAAVLDHKPTGDPPAERRGEARGARRSRGRQGYNCGSARL